MGHGDPNGMWRHHGDPMWTWRTSVERERPQWDIEDPNGDIGDVEDPKEAHGVTRVTWGRTEGDRPQRRGGDRAPLPAQFRPPLSARFRLPLAARFRRLAAHFRPPPWAQRGGSAGWWRW